MGPQARQALRTIRAGLADGRYRVTRHCTQRMDQRGLFWADVLAVVDAPRRVSDGGDDRHGRPKWVLAGPTPDGRALELVVVLDQDHAGRLVVFITLYWQRT